MPDVAPEAHRHHYTRVCMLSDHAKCLGFYELPVTGRVSCDCACHEQLPTLWSEPEEEAS